MRVFQRKQLWKKGRPGGQQLFPPKHPDYEKNRKIYWPLPVGHTHATFRDGSPQKAAQENTHPQTSSEDMKWRSNIRTEQSRKENPKMTTSIERTQTRTQQKKHQTSRRNTKKGKLQERRQQLQTMQAQETSWTERRLCSKHPNAKRREIKSNEESVTPSKHRPRTWNKHMFCGWKKSPKEKKKQWFCERTYSQGSPKGKQNEICFFHCFPFQVCAGAWGKEKTQDAKEEL